MIKYIKVFLLILLLHFYTSAEADERLRKEPRLGLVLSGGGARGLAHIGVLEVLDSLGIRPDYITGTSMGSIVGGLYSIGYSGAELRKIVTSVSWDKVLSDYYPLNSVELKEKEVLGRTMFSFSLKRRKFQLPSGIIQGQHIIRMLDSLVAKREVPEDFNAFPIPFHAITTDLTTGSTYIFDHGKLTMAMRASMAIPSAFSPVKYKSRVLVDGGVIDNLPIAEVRRMGADFVIAVNVGYLDYPDEEQLNSLIGVLNKVSTLYGRNETFRIMDEADILIQPNLKEYSIMSFNKASEVISIGKDDARMYVNDLDTLPHHALVKEKVVHSRVVQRIIYDGISNETADVFNHRLDFTPGQIVDDVILSKWNSQLVATNLFHWVQSSFENSSSGVVLRFSFNKKESQQLSFRLAYHNSTKLEMAIQYQYFDSTLVNRRLLTVLNLSSTPDFLGAYELYFGRKKDIGIEFRSLFDNQHIPIYEENDKLGTMSLVDFKQYLSLNYYLSQNGRLQLSAIADFDRSKPRDGLSLLFVDKIKQVSVIGQLRYTYNALDRSFLPQKGWFVDATYSVKIPTSVTSTVNFDDVDYVTDDRYGVFSQWSCLVVKPVTFIKRWTFTGEFRMGISLDEMNHLDRYVLGGIHSEEFTRIIPVAGVGYGQYIANSYYNFGAGLRYRIGSDFFVRGKVSLLTTSDSALKDFRSDDNMIPAIDFGLGYRSVLGDIAFNYGYNFDDYHSYWNISFYPFR
ncbi:patatin-like phospholipase family protein [Halosquirtibacter xylanolyticus]|uniref:patatin-like phospholipase family protein n=1 Tax=Halosquirtibacter xylanolyticus TaxID=3374599 RepID=UPI0037481104|nr:patatin-like phospholipase family protein [Prolixibacteraceae bacterium]